MRKSAIVRVIQFLILVYGVSWGLYAFDQSRIGTEALSQGETLPLGMFMPAFIALLFDLFSDRSSSIHYKMLERGPRIVIFSFFLLTVMVAAVNIVARMGILRGILVASAGNLVFTLWTLLLIHQMRHSKADDFGKAGLQLGDPSKGIPIAAGVVIFFLMQAGLNLVFSLGEWRGIQDNIVGFPTPSILYPFALIVYLGIVVVGTPLGNMAILFGEEYAWRGFLLRELEPLGRRKATLAIGLIWGLWHVPILLTGIHTYPPTWLGFMLALTFFSLWSFVQSYMVYKAGSIWAAAFLHGIVNGVYAFMLTYLVCPGEKLFSFGLGALGLAMLAVIVVLILRDPIWSRTEDEFVVEP